jgi:hypothetical protein
VRPVPRADEMETRELSLRLFLDGSDCRFPFKTDQIVERFLLWKLTGFQLVKKFHAFYGTRTFIKVFTITHHLPVS